MTERITKDDLRGSVAYLNKLTGNSTYPWKTDDEGEHLRTDLGYMIPNDGTFVLDWANGGVSLCTMGGRTVLHRGTKRDLYNRLRAFISGVEAGIGLEVKS